MREASTMRKLTRSCPNGNCPQVIDPEDASGDVLVQGYATEVSAPDGEHVVRLPVAVLTEAMPALLAHSPGAVESLTAGPVADFGALFDRFTTSAFRLETFQAYSVDEDADAIADWRAGRARPEFSVRTSPWAARLAATSLAGKVWRRVRVVDLPLSEYVRWEMAAYQEAAVLGEEIRILPRTAELADLNSDFWLFDAETASPYAVDQRYDTHGRPGQHQLVVDPAVITAHHIATAERAWEAAVPLNQWLASPARPLGRTA